MSASAAKKPYHHGDLREELITATMDLINADGADGFTLSDACKRAGVSTAAPYRHFKDREELLAAVTSRGFRLLAEQDRLACESAGEGTVAGIVALGKSYVRFAHEQPGLFRMMFGQHPGLSQYQIVEETGRDCFGYVIGQVTQFCQENNLPGDARMIAVSLWTYVHGMSSLLVDGKYGIVAPDADLDALLEQATPQILGAPEAVG